MSNIRKLMQFLDMVLASLYLILCDCSSVSLVCSSSAIKCYSRVNMVRRSIWRFWTIKIFGPLGQVAATKVVINQFVTGAKPAYYASPISNLVLFFLVAVTSLYK